RMLARLEALGVRLRDGVLSLLRASSLLAAAFARKGSSERRLREWGGEREEAHRRRQTITQQMQASHSTSQQRQKSANALETSVALLGHKREAICAKLREDYQIELQDLYRDCLERDAGWFEREPEPMASEDGPPMSPLEEIVDLQKRLGKLG